MAQDTRDLFSKAILLVRASLFMEMDLDMKETGSKVMHRAMEF